MVKVVGFDHLVLRCADVDRSLTWYCEELGLEPVRVDEWRRGEAPFPSARVDERTIIDLVAAERTGENVAHLCFVVERADFEAVVKSGRLEVLSGPDGGRFGARGIATSLYIADPDENVIELRYYGDG